MNCNQCIFKGNVPGSAHSTCSKTLALVDVNHHGYKNGWAFFPVNFDPNWIISCDSYTEEQINLESLTQEELQKLLQSGLRKLQYFGISRNPWDLLRQSECLAIFKELNAVDATKESVLLDCVKIIEKQRRSDSLLSLF